MNNIQVLKWGLIVMVILNLVLMGLVWKMSWGSENPVPRDPDITRVFDFNPDQVRQFEQSKRMHQEKMHELQRLLAEKSIAYYQAALESPGVADSLLAEINMISGKIYQNNLSHFTDISEICTPGQRANMKGFIASLVKRPPPPEGRRPPPR